MPLTSGCQRTTFQASSGGEPARRPTEIGLWSCARVTRGGGRLPARLTCGLFDAWLGGHTLVSLTTPNA